MSSQLTHDVVATIGEYTERQTGQKRKRYLTCGKCFTDPEGRQSLKLDAIPGPGWSGWLSLYPVEKPQQSRPPAAASSAPQEEEDIPF